YYIYYRKSGNNAWTFAGTTTKYEISYALYSLQSDQKYDFAVAAYNNLGFVSSKVTVDGLIPQYDFALPAVTGIKLSNSTESAYVTDAPDFNIAWDDQSNLVINGRPFSEYLKYYEIRLYDGEAYIKSFYSPTNAFNLTLALNETKIRKPT
ncbi:fibronectin type III domain-containing protein, partial [Salmonella enterica]